MAIDVTGANTYFGVTVHVKAATWTEVSANLKAAAVAHAKRVVARFLNIKVSELDADTTDDDDFPRHDVAVYEQALWMVQQSDAVVNGEESAPKVIGSKSEGAVEQENFGWTIAPEAMRFLVEYPRVIRLFRG